MILMIRLSLLAVKSTQLPRIQRVEESVEGKVVAKDVEEETDQHVGTH